MCAALYQAIAGIAYRKWMEQPGVRDAAAAAVMLLLLLLIQLLLLLLFMLLLLFLLPLLLLLLLLLFNFCCYLLHYVSFSRCYCICAVCADVVDLSVTFAARLCVMVPTRRRKLGSCCLRGTTYCLMIVVFLFC